jgi:hypothetical protein
MTSADPEWHSVRATTDGASLGGQGSTKEITNRTMKIQKRSRAPSIATPATPPKPTAAAINATTRK